MNDINRLHPSSLRHVSSICHGPARLPREWLGLYGRCAAYSGPDKAFKPSIKTPMTVLMDMLTAIGT